MWIYTQDKKQIINTNELLSLETALVAFSKKSKCSVVGITANSLSGKTLGLYADEKCAMDELENLFNAIDEGKKTYQMP